MQNITPWSNAKEGNKFNTGIGQDCSFCPPGDNGHHQYKIEEGCFVDGVPSCRWCAYTEEVWENYQKANAIEPVGEPNAYCCEQAGEPGHTGGWFCVHPGCVVSPYPDENELQALERLDQYLEGDSEIEEL